MKKYLNVRTILAVTGLSAMMIGGFAATVNAQGAARIAQVLVTAKARERHPEIRKAMKALQRAKVDLRRADRDFGGHRARAAELIDQALSECQAALNADRH